MFLFPSLFSPYSRASIKPRLELFILPAIFLTSVSYFSLLFLYLLFSWWFPQIHIPINELFPRLSLVYYLTSLMSLSILSTVSFTLRSFQLVYFFCLFIECWVLFINLFFYNFFFIFTLYIILLVLPNIKSTCCCLFGSFKKVVLSFSFLSL